jgi:hypothetical protein
LVLVVMAHYLQAQKEFQVATPYLVQLQLRVAVAAEVTEALLNPEPLVALVVALMVAMLAEQAVLHPHLGKEMLVVVLLVAHHITGLAVAVQVRLVLQALVVQVTAAQGLQVHSLVLQ